MHVRLAGCSKLLLLIDILVENVSTEVFRPENLARMWLRSSCSIHALDDGCLANILKFVEPIDR